MAAAYHKDMCNGVRLAGYDGAISIEHKDSLMDRLEGLEKAARFLKDCIICEGKTEMWWA